jgi:hypothetical protein
MTSVATAKRAKHRILSLVPIWKSCLTKKNVSN